MMGSRVYSIPQSKMAKAGAIRARVQVAREQVEILRMEASLAKLPEFEKYFEQIGKMINAKVKRLLSLELSDEMSLEKLHYERDRILSEIKTLKLVAEAPKRAVVEVPRIEANIDQLDAEASAIEQTFGHLVSKGTASA